MSSPFSIVPIEACQDSRLGKMQLRVLIALLSFRAKNTDIVWPSREQISSRCGYNKIVITRVTTQLVKLGWLVKVGKGGFSKSCKYQITVPNLVAVDGAETVTNSVTVDEQDNGNHSGYGNQVGYGNQTGADNGNHSGTSTVTNSVTGKEQTRNRQGTDHSDITPKHLGEFDFSAWTDLPKEQVWKDFKKLRTARRAPVTQTVINQLGKQLTLASENGFSVDDCLAVAIEANWQTYKFDWHKNRETQNAKTSTSNGHYQTKSERADQAARDYLANLPQ